MWGCVCSDCTKGKVVIRHTFSYMELNHLNDAMLFPILKEKGMPLFLDTKGYIRAIRGEFSWTDSGSYRTFIWIGDDSANSDKTNAISSVITSTGPISTGILSTNQARSLAPEKQAPKRVQRSFVDDKEPQRSIDLTYED